MQIIFRIFPLQEDTPNFKDKLEPDKKESGPYWGNDENDILKKCPWN